jgi:hypothetical protein
MLLLALLTALGVGRSAEAAGNVTAEVLFVTEATKVQGERSGGSPTRADGSCACPGHPTRSFCPLDGTPGQCDAATHKPCEHGGHCAPPPPDYDHGPGALPISTMNPSIVVTENGTVVLIVQMEFESYKGQQRPPPTVNMVSSTDNGRSWSNVSRMGPPGAPQGLYSPTSKTLFVFAKSANMVDNGTRPTLPDACYQSQSKRPGDPTAWCVSINSNLPHHIARLWFLCAVSKRALRNQHLRSARACAADAQEPGRSDEYQWKQSRPSLCWGVAHPWDRAPARAAQGAVDCTAARQPGHCWVPHKGTHSNI